MSFTIIDTCTGCSACEGRARLRRGPAAPGEREHLGDVQRGSPDPSLLDLGLERTDPVDAFLLLLPVGLHPGGPLVQVGQLLLELVQPLPRGLVGLLAQGGPFDLDAWHLEVALILA